MTFRVRISVPALRANLASIGADDVVDVRADAWGHGASVVARAALDAGAAAVLADDADLAPLAAAGVEASRIRTTGVATVDPYGVFGLDGRAVPVMRAVGSVISTKALLAGEGVSYGHLHVAPHDTRIALVSGGYAQGVVRALGSAASVVVAGERCAILGRVAMDVCVVEIGDREVARETDAWFFGDPAHGHPAIGEWVALTGLDPAELVTAVGVHTERSVA